MTDAKNYSGGISFAGLLCIVFITLKLTHVIDWSWWWVLAPLWAPIVLALIFVGICFSVILLGAWSLRNKA